MILRGNNAYRVPTAVDLYQQEYASRLMLSTGRSTNDNTVEMLLQAGIPTEALLINDQASDSTWEEARQIMDLLHREQAASALIVTDGGHSRRAGATYEQFQGGDRIDLTFIASQKKLSPETWWRDPSSRSAVRSEYIKMAYYLLRYGIFPLWTGKADSYPGSQG